MFSKISSGLLGWINRTEPPSDHQPLATSINDQLNVLSPENDAKVETEKNGDCGGANLEDRENKENLQEKKKEINDVMRLTQDEKGGESESKIRIENEKEFEVVGDEKLERNRTIRFPVRPEAEDCSSYLHTGLCKFGINCKFNHPPNWKPQVGKVKEREESLDSAAQVKEKIDSKVEEIDCKYFDSPGGCKSGKASKVSHSTKPCPTVELNFMGLPIRPGERDCSFYMSNGSCKFGVNCCFSHPDPTSVGEYENQSGDSSGRSILLPNASQSTPGSWSPFALSDSPAYVPLMFPSTQGVTSLPEWHAYQAPVYPPERSMQLASAYATICQSLERNVYTHQEQQILVDEFPERPGQPECNRFLKTGYCKHRSGCNFHHPKNEIAKSTSCALSDSALPLRPAVQPLIHEAIASPSYDAPFTRKNIDQSFVLNVPKSKLKQPKPIPTEQNANQNVRCELCNIKCASIQLYANHLYGKKHTNNLQKLQAQKQMSQAAEASEPTTRSNNAGKTGTLSGKGMLGSTRVVTDLERKEKKLLEGGTAVQSLRVCAICNVVCNGEIAFAEHLSGKKHLTQGQALVAKANSSPSSATSPKAKSTAKPRNGEDLVVHNEGKKKQANVEKSQNPKVDPTSSASAATPPPVSQLKEPEDVETKIRKVLECGAPEDAVRTCTICNVVCNSETVFSSHLGGQKHAAMVKQKHAEEEATIANATNAKKFVTQSRATVEDPSNKSCSSGEIRTPSGISMAGDRSVVTDSKSKEWKLLEGGIAVGSLKVCTICNVGCIGEVTFAGHLAGKKHLTQVGALTTKANLNPNSATSPNPNSTEKITTEPRKGESLWCELCEIRCTRFEDLVIHKQGKKHKTKVEELQKPKTVDRTSPGSPLAVSKEPMNGKLLKCGEAADAVKICTICSVICKSETVFNSHLAGKRHATMVNRKQAQEEEATGNGNATNAQGLVTPPDS